MNKAMSMIRFLLVGIGCIVLVAMWCHIQSQPIVKLVPVQSPIPSVRQIQQRLKDTGKERYDPGPIDGIPGPNTITGWNNYTKDQFAKGEFEGE